MPFRAHEGVQGRIGFNKSLSLHGAFFFFIVHRLYIVPIYIYVHINI